MPFFELKVITNVYPKSATAAAMIDLAQYKKAFMESHVLYLQTPRFLGKVLGAKLF
jgi:hypothetical protein